MNLFERFKKNWNVVATRVHDSLNPLGSAGRDESYVVPMLNGDVAKFKFWSLPVFSCFRNHDFESSAKANKYLNKQNKRIERAIKEGNSEKAFKIWVVMFQRSYTYWVCFLNSTLRGWYFKYSSLEIKRLFIRIKRINQRLDMNALYRRVYIPKPNGKTRPLGVPKLEWRVSLSMINDITSRVTERYVDDDQFGFRPGRNVWQAWERILYNVKVLKLNMYEFDLDSCFNRISVTKCLEVLRSHNVWEPFVLYIKGLITTSPIVDQNLDKETEMEIVKLLYFDGRYNPDDLNPPFMMYKDAILKFGLPQGWSLSPLLSILTINEAFKLNPLVKKVLYADDGLLFFKEKSDLKQFNWKIMEPYGIYPSPGNKKSGFPKCGIVKDTLTFLGVTYSIRNDSFLTNTGWKPNNDHTMEILKKEYLNIPYGKTDPKPWTWKIHPDSWLGSRHKILSLINLYCAILWILGFKDIKRFGLRFISYATMSSYACQSLLDERDSWENRKKVLRYRSMTKKFNPSDPSIFKHNWDRDYKVIYRNEYSGGSILNIKHIDFPSNLWYQSDIDFRHYMNDKRYDRDVLYIDPS